MATANNMKYVRLGRSGLRVSRVILGCMSYGPKEWASWMIEEPEAIRHIRAAYDLGINAFDTATTYSNGESERILGKAIKQHALPRDEIVIFAKVGATLGRTIEPTWYWTNEMLDNARYINQYGLSRKVCCTHDHRAYRGAEGFRVFTMIPNLLQHIFDSTKKVLERLQVDYVDVLVCHRVDPNTPIEETMHALHDVVQAGYARYIGMSSCWAWQFAKMQAYARSNNLTEFISMQNFYTAIYREEEREMVPLIKDLGVGMTPWSPLAGGFLARPIKVAQKTKRQETDWLGGYLSSQFEKHPWLITVNERVEAIAKSRNVSMAQVSLAWSLSKDFMTAPIIGSTSIDKLKDSCAAVNLELSAEELKSIDELYQPMAVFGHS